MMATVLSRLVLGAVGASALVNAAPHGDAQPLTHTHVRGSGVAHRREWTSHAMASRTSSKGSVNALEGLVQTPLGPVQGVVLDSARVFMGVPFAMPPVDSLRWQSPVPAVAWGPSVLQGIYDPPGCIQTCEGWQPPHVCPGYTSENCLYLNVWTPRLATITQPLPVLIFIHGGNFRTGYAGGIEYGIVYDASDLVNTTGIIVVSIQYRLGAFGFLYGGNTTGITGNYGLQDQEMAMAWVKANIASFGGDPTRVTISGQSAGAMSVASHLTRPQSAGLYDQAIMHSEPFSLPFRDQQAGVELANVFAKYANCSDGSGNNWPSTEACLRAADSDTLLSAQMSAMADLSSSITRILQVFMPFTPTYGTPYLPLHPMEAFQKGLVLDVPTIMGTVGSEADLFIYGAFGKNVSELEYYVALGVILGLKTLGPVGQQYPLPSPVPNDLRPQLSKIGSDVLFVCSTRNASDSIVNTPRRNGVWVYQYTHVETWSSAMWGPDYPFTECWTRACHASDLPSLFHPNYPALGTNYTTAENTMSARMQWYWANFVATGDPGVGSTQRPMLWPRYNSSVRPFLMIDTPITTAADPHGVNCNFWDSLGYNYY